MLNGLPLSSWGLAADMPMLGFGQMTANARGGLVATYSLHLQCPWRLRSQSAILTGNSDVYRYAGEHMPADWSHEDGNSRFAKRIAAVIATEPVVHAATLAMATGDLRLELSGDLLLEVFPNSVDDEQWRFFRTQADEDHLVFPQEAD